MRRIVPLLALAALCAAPGAAAQTPPPTIPAGVTIAGVDVGGLTGAEARPLVQAAFDEKLAFRFHRRTWAARPIKFGAPSVGAAVAAALAAQPDEAIGLTVRARMWKIRRYTAYLARLFQRDAKSSQVFLRNGRPFVTEAVWARSVKRLRMVAAIRRAIVRTERTPIRLQIKRRAPAVTRMNFGPIVIVKRESRRLELWRGMRFVRRFMIAVGTPAHPTPLGRYSIVSRERHPTWNPPDSPWAAGLGPVPPGPSNPLGTRWIGTSAPGIGIHGTPAPSTVGTAASHGCIRMYMSDVEWLFERVRVGAPVFFVRA